jgi:hypothetical protein
MTKPKNKKDFIDFNTLTKQGLVSLSQKWETDARIFEGKLQSYMNNPKANEEKVERLWRVGHSLWRRVNILETWRRKNSKD